MADYRQQIRERPSTRTRRVLGRARPAPSAYNRLNVITRQPAGSYQPGQWG